MSNFLSFIFGTVFGAYISQNYKIPDVKTSLNMILSKIEEIEKNSRTKEEIEKNSRTKEEIEKNSRTKEEIEKNSRTKEE